MEKLGGIQSSRFKDTNSCRIDNVKRDEFPERTQSRKIICRFESGSRKSLDRLTVDEFTSDQCLWIFADLSEIGMIQRSDVTSIELFS